jgi:RNA polymerase sigma-70 factor (ECF subfamily)
LVETAEAQRRFHDLLWPHLRAVARIALILCGGDQANADDLTQDTMLKAYKGIGQFRAGTDAKAWLLTILRRSHVDRARATGTRAGPARSLDALGVDPAEPPHAEVTDQAALWERPDVALAAFSDQQVIDALQRLPEEIRLTLLLVDVEGLDHADAASILEVPAGTIKSRAHRGRGMLREALLPVAREMRLIRD